MEYICVAKFCTNMNRNSLLIPKLSNRNKNNISQMGSICKQFTNTLKKSLSYPFSVNIFNIKKRYS